MDERSKPKPSRRTFLTGLVTGAGVVAVAAARPTDAGKPELTAETPSDGQILYRRTEETNRYYRTLYS